MAFGLAVMVDLWRFNPISNLIIHPGPQTPCFIDVHLRPGIAVRSGTLIAAVRDYQNIMNS